MYTKAQKQLLAYTRRKVKEFFEIHPAPTHDFDHATHVGQWAARIAEAEHNDVVLAELAGLLHDVGRGIEAKFPRQSHHELSYKICSRWFRNDPVFRKLPVVVKKKLLYAVRYHGNDEANRYPLAWILRDADKLDMLGKRGVQRTRLCHPHNKIKMVNDLRLRFHVAAYIKSAYAERIIKTKKLLGPIIQELRRINRRNLKSIKV